MVRSLDKGSQRKDDKYHRCREGKESECACALQISEHCEYSTVPQDFDGRRQVEVKEKDLGPNVAKAARSGVGLQGQH